MDARVDRHVPYLMRHNSSVKEMRLKTNYIDKAVIRYKSKIHWATSIMHHLLRSSNEMKSTYMCGESASWFVGRVDSFNDFMFIVIPTTLTPIDPAHKDKDRDIIVRLFNTLNLPMKNFNTTDSNFNWKDVIVKLVEDSLDNYCKKLPGMPSLFNVDEIDWTEGGISIKINYDCFEHRIRIIVPLSHAELDHAKYVCNVYTHLDVRISLLELIDFKPLTFRCITQICYKFYNTTSIALLAKIPFLADNNTYYELSIDKKVYRLHFLYSNYCKILYILPCTDIILDESNSYIVSMSLCNFFQIRTPDNFSYQLEVFQFLEGLLDLPAVVKITEFVNFYRTQEIHMFDQLNREILIMFKNRYPNYIDFLDICD